MKRRTTARSLWTVAPVMVALALPGCSKQSESELEAKGDDAKTTQFQGGMAVIDLDEIARRIGRDTQMADSIRRNEAELTRQLAELQATAKTQFAQKKMQIQATPPASQADQQARESQLRQIEQQLNAQLAQAQSRASQRLVNFRQSVIVAFRKEVTPVAHEVAAELGLTSIAVKQDFLLSVDPDVEITSKVAKRMASSVAKTPPASSANEVARQPASGTMQR